jgi:hypothetical protein
LFKLVGLIFLVSYKASDFTGIALLAAPLRRYQLDQCRGPVRPVAGDPGGRPTNAHPGGIPSGQAHLGLS